MKVWKGVSALKVGCMVAIILVGVPETRAHPPDPDNAAVLYYQAFLLHQQSAGAMSQVVTDFSEGAIDPNDEIRRYVGDCRSAIDYALLAAQREQCTWGTVYSKGFNAFLPHLTPCRSLCRIMLADARLLAADGVYRQALDRCLKVKRLAKHVGDEAVIPFVVSLAIDGKADECISDILSMMTPDLSTLEWFRTQWMPIAAREPSCARALEGDQEMALDMMRMDKLDDMVGMLDGVGMPDAKGWRAKVDEDLLSRSRAYHTRYVKEMRDILAAPTSYEKKHAGLEAMTNCLMADANENADAVLTTGLGTPGLGRLYGIQMQTRAQSNALGAAIEIYIAKARTGELPDQLPSGAPKDPFSGMDYLYKNTGTRFVLRCQGKDLDKGMVREFQFIVK